MSGGSPAASVPSAGSPHRSTPSGVLALGRADRWPLGLVLATTLALWAPRLQGPIDLRWDAGVYYTAGSALADGRGYLIPSEPGAVAEIQYPPALPILAAAVQRVVGTTDAVAAGHAMRLVYFVLTVVYAATVYVVARRYLGPAWSAFAALLTTLHAYTVFLSSLMQAEIPYAVVTALFFALAAPPPGRRWRSAPGTPARWLPELLAGLAFLVRTAGLALIGAWILDLLLRRRWTRAAVAAGVAAVCVGGWQLYVGRAEASRLRRPPAYGYQYAPYQFYNVSYATNLAYVDPFRPELGRLTARRFAVRTAAHVRAVVPDIGELVSADGVWWVGRVQWGESFWARARFWLASRTTLALALLSLTGMAILAYRGVWIVPLYVLASLVLIVVTPWPGQFWRYLTPLMPLFAIALAVTLDASSRALAWALTRARPLWSGRFPRWVPSTPGAVTAVLLLGVQAWSLYRVASYTADAVYQGRDGRPIRYRLIWYDHAWRKHDAAIDWVARHARREDVVISATPHWVYLRTGLVSVMPPFEVDPALASALMESVRGRRYVILDNLRFLDSSQRYVAPAMERYPERWRLVFPGEPGGSSVYELAGSLAGPP